MNGAIRWRERVDAVVVGAGVVGLAVAQALALAGREVTVLEAADAIGTETSSRNSEVIHAGIYYPAGSLKARLCVQGRDQLYAFCAEHGVPHARPGKLIVAVDDTQQDKLRGYQASAEANGAGRLTWVDRATLRRLEPDVEGVAAVHSPLTGIVDSHAFMLALQGELEAAGGVVALRTPVASLVLTAAGPGVRVDDGAGELLPRLLVNAAGLQAPVLARGLAGQAVIPAARYARGHYYAYPGRTPFSHLVYPVAQAGGLGVHVTLDLAGQIRFGPDVEWVDGPDYAFDDARRDRFVDAIRRYYPGLEADRLVPGYVGVRPKIAAAGTTTDFGIVGPADHGLEGVVHLLGIESPGLTAALAIGGHCAALLGACER